MNLADVDKTPGGRRPELEHGVVAADVKRLERNQPHVEVADVCGADHRAARVVPSAHHPIDHALAIAIDDERGHGACDRAPPNRRPSGQRALANPEEDDGRDDQHVQQRRHHAAEHRRRQRLHHVGARRVRPHDRQERGDDRGDRHDFRAQPQQRALDDGVAQRRRA